MGHWQELAIATGALTTLVALYKVLWPILKWTWDKAKAGYKRVRAMLMPMFAYHDLKDQVTESRREISSVMDLLHTINKELKPNGGSSMRDQITRIERRQVLAEQRHRALIEDSDSGIFEADANGDCIWVNSTFCRLAGRMPAQLMGKGWKLAIRETDREKIERLWYAAISDDVEFDHEVMFEASADGIQRFRLISHKMLDDSGKPLGFMGVVTPLH